MSLHLLGIATELPHPEGPIRVAWDWPSGDLHAGDRILSVKRVVHKNERKVVGGLTATSALAGSLIGGRRFRLEGSVFGGCIGLFTGIGLAIAASRPPALILKNPAQQEKDQVL